ncbi:unnamed protein product [Closterium sp. NIES-54]
MEYRYDLPETAIYYHTLIQNVLAEAPRVALFEHSRYSHADLLKRAGRLSHADRSDRSSHVSRRALQAPRLQNVTLAPNRTYRRNPLNGLNYYTGGWNPSSKDYWASVMWSVVYAPLLGLLWLILGLGILGFSLLTCLCCRDKWSEMRDPAYAKYTKKDLWVPLGFMLLGIVAVLVGFSVMLAGGVQLSNRVHKVTDYITESVHFTTSVIFNMTSIVQLTATINITNTVVPPAQKADIQSKAVVANQTATELQAKTEDGITIINNTLRVVTLTFSIIGCIITALCILALIFSLLKWVVASNVIVTLIWVVVFFTWCTTAGFIIAYLVNGDTSVALEEVEQSPTMNSAMDTYLHCIPSDQLLNATRYARYTASTALTTANTSVATNTPEAFDLVNATGGICVPYGPPPDYTRNMSYCTPIHHPQRRFLGQNHAPPVSLLASPLPSPILLSPPPPPAPPPEALTAAANSSAVVPEVVQNNLTAAARPPLRNPPLRCSPRPCAPHACPPLPSPLPPPPGASSSSQQQHGSTNGRSERPHGCCHNARAARIHHPQRPHPRQLLLCRQHCCGENAVRWSAVRCAQPSFSSVLILVNCSCAANIAAFALNEAEAMVMDFKMLWVGFLVITIACMMQALSMPIYVFRAVRLGDKLGDTETEGLYKVAAVPVAYPAEGGGYDGQTQGNEPSFAEGSSNSCVGLEQPYSSSS